MRRVVVVVSMSGCGVPFPHGIARAGWRMFAHLIACSVNQGRLGRLQMALFKPSKANEQMACSC